MDSKISEQLTPVELNIEQIYLDPNNPRFVDDNWRIVQDSKIDQPNVQLRARERMMARSFNVDKLRANMEINGYLPIDRVVVRRFSDDKYVVLEGNRRITAAKLILEIYEQGAQVSEPVLSSLKKIPCLEYVGTDSQASWILQGLRHITGIVGWSAFSKAKMLTERWEDGAQNMTELGNQFGLSRYGAAQWIRAYKAFIQAKTESNYTQEINKRAYPYFQELFGRSNVKLVEWLGWNNDSNVYRFENEDNLDHFLSWLYPKDDPEDGRDLDDIRGNWEERRVGNVQQLRDVSYLLRTDVQQFEGFLHGAELETAVAEAKVKEADERRERIRIKQDHPAERLLESMETLENQLADTPIRFKEDLDLRQKLLDKIRNLEDRLSKVKIHFGD